MVPKKSGPNNELAFTGACEDAVDIVYIENRQRSVPLMKGF